MATDPSLQADLRKQRTLGLSHFGFGRAAICCCFADSRMGRDRLINGVNDRKGVVGDGQRYCDQNCRRQDPQRPNSTHTLVPRGFPD